jgi:hypothetical protein
MAPKGNSQKDKSRKGITRKIKQEIFEKSENGGKTSMPAKEYGLSQSTISTILLNKDKMKATKVSDASARMSKGRERNVDQDDVEDLVKSRSRELTTEDLQELDSFIEHDSGEEEQEEDDALTTAQLNEFLISWDTVKKYASRYPSIEQTELQICLFDNKAVPCFKKVLNCFTVIFLCFIYWFFCDISINFNLFPCSYNVYLSKISV